MGGDQQRRLVSARLADRLGGDAARQLVPGRERFEAGGRGEPLGDRGMAVDRHLAFAAEPVADRLGAAHVVGDREQDPDRPGAGRRRSAPRRGRRHRRAADRSAASRSPAPAMKATTSAPKSPGCHSGWRRAQLHSPGAISSSSSRRRPSSATYSAVGLTGNLVEAESIALPACVTRSPTLATAADPPPGPARPPPSSRLRPPPPPPVPRSTPPTGTRCCRASAGASGPTAPAASVTGCR